MSAAAQPAKNDPPRSPNLPTAILPKLDAPKPATRDASDKSGPTTAAPAAPKTAQSAPATGRKSAPPPRKPCANGCLTPVEAVTYADNVAPRAGIAAEFDVTVRSVGEMQGRYYLNSETDYRERNCLSIVVTPNVAQALSGSVNLNTLAVAMKGRRIAVQGVARRVRVDFTEDGQATGKYYYQVHVVVTDPRQIVMN